MKRLLEDAQLSSELRGDLARARVSGHDYPATAKLLQLQAAITDRTPRSLDTLGAPPTRAVHAAWKLAALAALGGGAALLAKPVTPVPPPAADTSSAPVAPAAAPGLPPTAAPALVAAPATTMQPSAALPPLAASTAPSTAPRSAAPSGPATRADDASSSRREIAQLVRIRALLQRDAAAAHRLAERSEREFPRGLLSEERRALAIVALAEMGSKQLAEQEARRYFASYPHSPMRALIEAALHR